MNETVANEMYELRNNEYSDFIELIYDLETKTSINARQMNILIDLDFFEEFGDANKLKEQYEIYQTFFGRKQIYKRDVESMGLTLDMVRPYSNNETEKMFRELNSLGLTKILAQNVQYTPRKLGDVISAQITHLGYITIMDDRYRGMAAVLSVDTKYSPKLKMYSLKNGTTLDCKIDKRTFSKMPLNNGDIVRIMGTKKKIEVSTGVNFPYSEWVLEQVCRFIVNMTSEYKRVYENGSRYPDVSLSLFSKCFTFAKFENSDVVTFKHIYEAIKNTNLVYDDVIRKELPIFKEKFKEFLEKENVNVEI